MRTAPNPTGRHVDPHAPTLHPTYRCGVSTVTGVHNETPEPGWLTQVDTDGQWSLLSEWKRNDQTGEWVELDTANGGDHAPPPPSDMTHRNKKVEWGKVAPPNWNSRKQHTTVHRSPLPSLLLFVSNSATWRSGLRWSWEHGSR